MKYGKLENGELTYYKPYRGGLELNGYIIFNPLKEQYIQAGWYPIIETEGVGQDFMQGESIIHYISPQKAQADKINAQLNDISELIKAVERIVALQGVTPEDKNMASQRLQLRDTLGKLITTDSGDGSAFNPFRWNPGESVVEGMWYKTPGGYIWEAHKNGIPQNEEDPEYFDVVGL